MSSTCPHPRIELSTEHAHALRRRKATSSPMLKPTTSACDYTKKSRQEPCAHSVQTYVVPSSSEYLSKNNRPCPELHLCHDDPRHHCPAQRPPLRAPIRGARPGRAEHARARARVAQGAPS